MVKKEKTEKDRQNKHQQKGIINKHHKQRKEQRKQP